MGDVQISGDLLLVKVFVVQVMFIGIAAFVLRRVLVTSTDGAVQRLNTETEAVRTKQADLNKKIKEADEELAKRKKEAEDLTKKMREEAEEAAKVEREKMVKKAREEGEEIIAKAQRTTDQIRLEVQKEMEIKTIDFAIEILNSVLSDKAKGVIDQHLLTEFAENLQKMDMNQVSVEIEAAEIITAIPMDAAIKNQFAKIIKEKLNRDIKINAVVEPSIAGGAILRFGSLALDGSLQNMIREAGTALKQKAEGV